ncbi:MAG: type IX secretion system membrane protein PorP/SprF [Flavobacteriaceae bacterium]|nr:type IX secretion system membrane protein PorP/SprF [Flavobacteriaceae bacterium]
MNKQIVFRVASFFGILAPLFVSAQTDPLFTHFTFNKLLYNAAYAGASDQFCINAISHQQWLGYDDESQRLKTQSGLPTSDKLKTNIAPKTTGFAFSAPILYKGINYGGAFFSFVDDKIAYEKNTYLKGGFSYAYVLPDASSIRIGIDFSSLTKGLDGSKLRAHDPGDPLIPSGDVSDTRSTMGAGIYYSTSNIIDGAYLGISSTHISPQTFNYGTNSTINITTNRHLYIVGGYHQNNFMGNPALSLDPAFLVKTVMGKGGIIKPEIDVQGMATWNDLFSGGANFRFYGLGADALSVMFGYYPPLLGANGAGSAQKLRVGYSYDLTLSKILRNSAGSHELQVNYCFMFTLPERPVKIYRHPRWMERPSEWD